MDGRLVTLQDWRRWRDQKYQLLPYVRKFSLKMSDELRSFYGQDLVPLWSKLWSDADDTAFVLESGRTGQYTFFGRNTTSMVKGTGDHAFVQIGSKTEEWQGSPLEIIKKWMDLNRAPKVEGAPKFIGGCVGYWGYDVVRSLENLPEMALNDSSYPDYYFMRVDELWIIDHENANLYCCLHQELPPRLEADDGLEEQFNQAVLHTDEMKEVWDQLIRTARTTSFSLEPQQFQIDAHQLTAFATDFPKKDFMNAVERIQDYIRAGDVFQVNLSLRQKRSIPGGAKQAQEIYEWLRSFNPSPYMAYLQFPELQIVSASPELLVKLENGQVSTRPIAGTRPRGNDEVEDERLRDELLSNEKERAEHIMLVDLERNDLGRVCKYGTVNVDDFMVIERYSHVMHIVSEVKGELAEGKDAFDCLAAVFPGGTITGAPKIRTMEIIEELEPVRRGAYTGSIGWIDYSGNMEFNIIIRTLVVSDGMGYVQAGAGIVIDSDPEREYVESLNKAKAIWKAIELSEMSAEVDRNS